jgi:hypothetical protein
MCVVAATFLPEISSEIWHWRHGDRVTFDGWSFLVPREWDAISMKDGVSISRMTRIFEREVEPIISIGRFRWPADRPFEDEKLKGMMLAEYSSSGYKFRHYEKVSLGAENISCLHFVGTHGADSEFMTCTMPIERLWFNFDGYSHDLPTAYTILQGIRPAPQR